MMTPEGFKILVQYSKMRNRKARTLGMHVFERCFIVFHVPLLLTQIFSTILRLGHINEFL